MQIDIATRGEICLARKALGHTQKTLSEMSKVNKTTISKIENGRFTGSFDIFERVLNAIVYNSKLVKKGMYFQIGMK